MTTIIAGGRDIFDVKLVEDAIKESGFKITKVIDGGASGIDTIAHEWAKRNRIPTLREFAKWDKYRTHPGKNPAGAIRNEAMACMAEQLIAIWDGKSPGTGNMIRAARKYGLKVYVKMV